MKRRKKKKKKKKKEKESGEGARGLKFLFWWVFPARDDLLGGFAFFSSPAGERELSGNKVNLFICCYLIIVVIIVIAPKPCTE